MTTIQNRRHFLAGLSAVGAAGLFAPTRNAAAEPPPEITTVRLPRWIGTAYCWAGGYLAEELLRAKVSRFTISAAIPRSTKQCGSHAGRLTLVSTTHHYI